MVIVVIMLMAAVLFFLSLSSFHNYSEKARVVEGLYLVKDAQSAIADYYTKQGTFPVDNAAANLAAPSDIQNIGVRNVEVSTTGIDDAAIAMVTITFNKRVYDGKTLVLTAPAPKGEKVLRWSCNGGTLTNALRPAECHNANMNDNDEHTDKRSIGVVVFIFFILAIKSIAFCFAKKYSVSLFFVEVVVATLLFLVVDYIYLLYFSPFYPGASFWVMNPYIYFLVGTAISWVLESIYMFKMRRKHFAFDFQKGL